MNFKIDCNLLESLVKTSQTRDLADDPVKKQLEQDSALLALFM